MYWAKKILEWTRGPEEALEICIYLNDKVYCFQSTLLCASIEVVKIANQERGVQYEIDGRDPNGYVGCMWSICGVHDQVYHHCLYFISYSSSLFSCTFFLFSLSNPSFTEIKNFVSHLIYNLSRILGSGDPCRLIKGLIMGL